MREEFDKQLTKCFPEEVDEWKNCFESLGRYEMLKISENKIKQESEWAESFDDVDRCFENQPLISSTTIPVANALPTLTKNPEILAKTRFETLSLSQNFRAEASTNLAIKSPTEESPNEVSKKQVTNGKEAPAMDDPFLGGPHFQLICDECQTNFPVGTQLQHLENFHKLHQCVQMRIIVSE